MTPPGRYLGGLWPKPLKDPQKMPGQSRGCHDCSPQCGDPEMTDPFMDLPLDKLREVRDRALGLRPFDRFQLHGWTFVMPGVLHRANAALLERGER